MDTSNTESQEVDETSGYEDDYNSTTSESNKLSYSNKNDDILQDSNKNQQIPLKPEKKENYTPIISFIENNSTNISSNKLQLLLITYGLAANIHKIHENDSIKVNITPNYIFIDDELKPYINFQKLNSDSKKQNADDFLFFNKEYNGYYPPEVKNESVILSDNISAKNKVDSYIFGGICLSLINNQIFNENDDLYQISRELDIFQNFNELIQNCLSDKPIHRPIFRDILYIIDSNRFLKDFKPSEIEKFKEYQKTVVDGEFIQPSTDAEFEQLLQNANIKTYNESDFKKSKKLGTGLQGSVRLAELKKTEIQVAYKTIKNPTKDENKKWMLREIEILASANHYAVIKLFGFISGDQPAILTPYEKNESLSDVIKSDYQLDFTQKFIIMYGIAAGMYYLHSKGIAHRDLKPMNVLLNDNFEPLISDFGLSKKVVYDPDYINEIKNDKQNPKENKGKNEVSYFNSTVLLGTPSYMAPEQLDSMNSIFSIYDAKLADIYSYSILLYNLFTEKEPWKSDDAIYRSLDGERPEIPNDMLKNIQLLIEACWVDDPSKRPTFEMILHMIGHPAFFKNIGAELDENKFKEYQKKVVDESFINNLFESNEETISFNDIVFPQIPKEKIFSNLDFQEVSSIDKKINPFFDYQIVKKDSKIYNKIDIKEEFYNDNEVISRLKTQIKVLFSINHPTFNPLFGIINSPPKAEFKEDAKDIYDIFPKNDIKPPSLITPFLPKGDLIKNQSYLTITQKFIILYGIAAGMYYLHKEGMAHLNLKSDNIYLNDEMEPIINIDIVSRPKHERDNLRNFLPLFSFSYVAPELLKFQERRCTTFNEKQADVYSFSMVAYFLMTGFHPWDSSRGFQPIVTSSMSEKRPKIDHIIPPPFDQLIQDCWVTSPSKRPSFKVILKRIGSEDFIKSIELLDLTQFQNYQKKVISKFDSKEFIVPIQICSIRKREEFEYKDFIGNGSFGQVSLYIDKTNGNKVTYKEIPENYRDFVKKQIKILPIMNFPSIISLYGFIEPEGEKKESAILFPYEQTNLETMLKNETIQNSSIPNWDYTQKCIVLYGIAFGLLKLHSSGISHQNLKPSNILLNEQNEPKITDFAISNFVDPNQSILQTMSVGSGYYTSPEAFFSKINKDCSYDEKQSDVYSFGMLAYYLMTAIQPFEETSNLEDLMEKIKEGKRPEIPNIISQAMKQLIESCWDSNATLRPTFIKIVEIISDASFYKARNTKFENRRFYDYQVKLGELKFIKYESEKIQRFQLTSISSNDFLPTPDNIDPEQILTEMADSLKDDEIQYRLACHIMNKKDKTKNLKKAVTYFERAAKQGHVNAIISLAILNKKGKGIKPNSERALELINKAIQKGSTDAMIILAKWYMTSFPRKYKEAVDLLMEADKNDHPDASALIGSLIERKRLNNTGKQAIDWYKKSCFLGSYEGMYHMATLEQNKNEAIRLYNLAAKNQNFNRNKTSAVFSLSILYEENGEKEKAFKLADHYRLKKKFVGYLLCSKYFEQGVGCEINKDLANECLEKASKKRFKSEQLKFAMLYKRGKGVNENKEEFLKWSKIAAKNGSSVAQANLCHYYLKHNDNELAFTYGKMSADAGNHLGIWNLCKFFKILNNDEQEVFYLKKLVDLGSYKALVNLGINYKRNNKNLEAFQKFKEAAEKNHPSGFFHCGNEMINGKLTTRNVEEGLVMMKKAADVGHIRAIKKLIRIYSKGLDGVDINVELANQYKEKLDQMPRYSKH